MKIPPQKQMRHFLFIIFIVICIIPSCKKYGEDARFTLRSPMNRITGTWKITAYEVDGIDSLSYYTFYGNDEFVVDKKVFTIAGTNQAFDWYFHSKKNNFRTKYPFYTIEKWIDTIIGLDTTFIKYHPSSNSSWGIEELTKKELIITQDFGFKPADNLWASYVQNHKITCQKIE